MGWGGGRGSKRDFGISGHGRHGASNEKSTQSPPTDFYDLLGTTNAEKCFSPMKNRRDRLLPNFRTSLETFRKRFVNDCPPCFNYIKMPFRRTSHHGGVVGVPPSRLTTKPYHHGRAEGYPPPPLTTTGRGARVGGVNQECPPSSNKETRSALIFSCKIRDRGPFLLSKWIIDPFYNKE